MIKTTRNRYARTELEIYFPLSFRRITKGKQPLSILLKKGISRSDHVDKNNEM